MDAVLDLVRNGGDVAQETVEAIELLSPGGLPVDIGQGLLTVSMIPRKRTTIQALFVCYETWQLPGEAM